MLRRVCGINWHKAEVVRRRIAVMKGVTEDRVAGDGRRKRTHLEDSIGSSG